MPFSSCVGCIRISLVVIVALFFSPVVIHFVSLALFFFTSSSTFPSLSLSLSLSRLSVCCCYSILLHSTRVPLLLTKRDCSEQRREEG
jgi:flagellar biosynthesis component FlhA